MAYVQPAQPRVDFMPTAVVDPPMDGRVLLVSNRLPVTVRDSAGGVEVVPSDGGLASGLRGYYQSASATWIGWPGPLSPAAARPGRGSLAAQLEAHNLRVVELAPSDVEDFFPCVRVNALRQLWC